MTSEIYFTALVVKFTHNDLEVLYEMPNDDSLGIETCNTVECQLFNRVLYD
jgi:hypothetical protein